MPHRVTSPRAPKVPAVFGQAREWAQGFAFEDSAALEALQVADVSRAPRGVRRVLDLYRTWEERDLGAVRLLKVPLSTESAWAVFTGTDGDDGFLELFDEAGRLLATGVTAPRPRGVTWDASPGDVRERLVQGSSQEQIANFFAALDVFQATPPGQGKVTRTELNSGLDFLLTAHPGDILDTTEKAAVLKAVLEAPLHAPALSLAQETAALYSRPPQLKLTGLRQAPFERGVIASARVQKGFPPGFPAFQELTLSAWTLRPSQVRVSTQSGALAHLMEAGLTRTEAASAVRRLQPWKSLYTARLVEDGPGGQTISRGVAVFAVDDGGRALKALPVPQLDDTESVRQELIAKLEQASSIPRSVAEQMVVEAIDGDKVKARWQLPQGGTLRVDLDKSTQPVGVSGLELPSLPGSTEEALSLRMPGQTVLSYANEGNLWWVAHRPSVGGPLSTSTLRIEVGGATGAITAKTFSASPADIERARNLALGLARIHAEAMVTEPSHPDAQRFEVALRTRFRSLEDIERQDATSPVWVPTTDLLQFAMFSIWDTVVFVTFTRDGKVRLEGLDQGN